jgi:hypothetical protein
MLCSNFNRREQEQQLKNNIATYYYNHFRAFWAVARATQQNCTGTEANMKIVLLFEQSVNVYV